MAVLKTLFQSQLNWRLFLQFSTGGNRFRTLPHKFWHFTLANNWYFLYCVFLFYLSRYRFLYIGFSHNSAL